MTDRKLTRHGFTLVEILVATALTLLMMGLVVTIFALVSDNVSGSRATIEMSEQLRTVADQLQMDLEGVTVITKPPRDPANGEGYLEYIEGVIGPVMPAQSVCFTNTDVLNNSTLLPGRDGNLDPDTTVGDIDDVLMFTTRALGKPFLGRSPGGPISSDAAEVCYFLRGRTLYRRVLLVMPTADALIDRQIAAGEVPNVPPVGPALGPEDDPRVGPGFYAKYDISVRQEGGYFDRRPQVLGIGTPNPERLVPNSLGDLTKRENRYGHQPSAFPHDARFWGRLGLPTLTECSFWIDSSTDGTDIDGDGVDDDDDADGDDKDADGGYYAWPFPWQREPSGHPFPTPMLTPDSVYYWSTDTTASCKDTNTDPSSMANRFQQLIVPYLHRDDFGVPTATLHLNGSHPTNDAAVYTATVTSSQGVFIELTEGPQAGGWFPPQPGGNYFDAWQRPYPWKSAGVGQELHTSVGSLVGYTSDRVDAVQSNYVSGNDRINEDVILTNVLSFDVKAWDPNAPVFAGAAVTGATTRTTTVLPGDVNYLPNYLRPFVDDLDDGMPDVPPPVAFGAYVDLNYMCRASDDPPTDPDPVTKYEGRVGAALRPHFGGPGNVKSLVHGLLRVPFLTLPWSTPLVPADRLASVYDTWSNHYEHDGVDQNGNATAVVNNVYGNVDEGRNGIDDPVPPTYPSGDGVVDDALEWEAPPPYPYPLRGMQIKIRVFEPTSRQIREITVVEEFADR